MTRVTRQRVRTSAFAIRFVLSIVGLLAPAVLVPGSLIKSAAAGTPNIVAPAVDFVAYHNRSSADHKAQMDKYTALGYRFISLSVYNTAQDPLYAAVMVKRPVVVAQQEFHGLSSAAMQKTFDEEAARGFGPVIITATGSAENPLFAAVFEPAKSIPLTRTALRGGDASDPTTFQGHNQKAKADGTILTWAGVYGDAADPRYIGIWRRNTDGIFWNADGADDSAADYQGRATAEASGWARPSFVTRSFAGRYLSIFVDNAIGAWVARHELTAEQYQAEFDAHYKQGYFPLLVQGGGAGSNIRFAALFVKQEKPMARQWTAKGSPSIGAVDQVMEQAMKGSNVRAAGLAVIKGTKLVLARGYTWAEPGYPVTEPTTLFRVASCSKTVTAIAIHQLIAEGKLKLTDTVQSILHLKTPTGTEPVDPRFAQITIQNLLEQNSGLSPEFMWEDPGVVAAFNASLPATQDQTASYMMTKKMAGNPGARIPDPGQPGSSKGKYCKNKGDLCYGTPGNATYYNNFGYWMLGRIVAKKRGQDDFVEAIRPSLMTPLKITRLRASRSLVKAQLPDEAHYYSANLALGKSVMTNDRPLVPVEYGDENIGKAEPAGGLSVAVTDFARILAALNVKEKNPMLPPGEIISMLKLASASFRGHGWDGMSEGPAGVFSGQKGGLLQTSQNVNHYESNGFSFVLCWNQVGVKGDWYPNFPELMSALQSNTASLTADLFPSYGMPAF
jgi:CubicO group peptidase (beta-lactamase class C family)